MKQVFTVLRRKYLLVTDLGFWPGYITAIYIGLIILTFAARHDEFFNLELNELGDFLAGAFGPPAFLWLVVGQLQQRREIALNTRSLELSLEPFFELAYQKSVPTDSGVVDHLVLTNYGPYCRKITAELKGRDVHGFKLHLHSIGNGAAQEFSLGQALKVEKAYKLVLGYETQSGKQGEKVFVFFRTSIDGTIRLNITDHLELIPEEYFQPLPKA